MSFEVKATKKELFDTISSFDEALKYWSVLLSDTAKFDEQVKIDSSSTTDLKDPLNEIAKVASLIRAHTTKVGLVFKPPVHPNAANSTLNDVSKTLLLLVSLFNQIDEDKFSSALKTELKQYIIELLSTYSNLLKEAKTLDYVDDNTLKAETTSKKSTKIQPEELDQVDIRLVSVAKIWRCCDKIESIEKLGISGIAKKSVLNYNELIDDALSELSEWVEDPTCSDDPFELAFTDDLEDEADEDKKIANEDNVKILLPHATNWTKKLKLLKILFSSINKRRIQQCSGTQINFILSQMDSLSASVDDFVATILTHSIAELEDAEKSVFKIADNLVVYVTVDMTTKQEDGYTKWYNTWKEKFPE